MSDTLKLSKTSGPAGMNAEKAAVCTIDAVGSGVVAFCRKHPKIIRVELFGSVAHGEATPSSDVDLVVTFAPTLKEEVRGFAFFGYLDDLQDELAVALDRPTHLTDSAGVESSVRIGNTSLARAIARDGQLIYEADHSTKGCARPHHRSLPQGGGTRR